MQDPNTVTVDVESKKEGKKHGINESTKSKENGHFFYTKEVVRDLRCLRC